MPHPLRTAFLPTALLALGAACSAALSEPARPADASVSAPTLTVTPRSATAWAGGSTLTFDAALANTATGTISWAVSPAIGSVSPSTGTHVVYTPPTSLAATAPVALVATSERLTDVVAITVHPAPTLAVNPTSATFNAGAAGRVFDATLAYTTATLTWSLSAPVGSVSPSTGAQVTYTPPATIDATTVVTLTVSGAGLSRRARLTVQPSTDPLLNVVPATAWTFAGGGAVGFDAALVNTSGGTISWALSDAVGSVSPSTGAHVTYTPPPSLATTTVVTLTATRGTLSDTAVITVGPTPSLDVRPATASTFAGGTTLGFDAVYLNSTGGGTVTWALSAAVGSVSPTTGAHVTYTPPPTVDADTVVTLTATGGGLLDTAVVTVRKPGAPAPANVVNHTNHDPGAIPVEYLTTVRNWGIVFQHKSIGMDMTQGMKLLASQNAARYTINLVGWNLGPLPAATWFDGNHGLGSSENGHSNSAESKTVAFYQTMHGLPMSYNVPWWGPIGNDSGVSGEYGLHVDVAMMKFCFLEMWYGTPQATFDLYRSMMEQLIADYPSVKFIWMTMPHGYVGGQTPYENVGQYADGVNALMRDYIAQHGGYLLDIADLESTCSNLSVAKDARGNSAVCTDWAYTASDPHMNAAGQRRLAMGLWSILARAAGYTP